MLLTREEDGAGNQKSSFRRKSNIICAIQALKEVEYALAKVGDIRRKGVIFWSFGFQLGSCSWWRGPFTERMNVQAKILLIISYVKYTYIFHSVMHYQNNVFFWISQHTSFKYVLELYFHDLRFISLNIRWICKSLNKSKGPNYINSPFGL